MLGRSAGRSIRRAFVLVAAATPLLVFACGGESDRSSDDAPAGDAGMRTAAGRPGGGAAGSGGMAGNGAKSGGRGGSGGVGGSKAGAGQGARAGTGSGDAGDAGAAGAGAGGAGGMGGHATGGQSGRAMGGAGMRAGSGGQSGAAAGASGAIAAVMPAVDAYCAAAMSCCASGPSSLADCEASYLEHAMNLASLKAGYLAVDSDALARCVAAYSGADQCNANVVLAACRGVLVGTRAVDESCLWGADCDRSNGEMTCLILDGSVPDPVGTCTPAPRAKLGEPCAGTCGPDGYCDATTYGVGVTYALCFEDDGLYCTSDGLDAVCKAILPLGAACTGIGPDCGSGAFCENTCQALSKLGEACGRACQYDLQCGQDGKCEDPPWADPDFGCKGWVPGL